MQNLHDDNHLDDLSRDAAERFQPDQQLHSWEKLHPHVDAAMPQEKERKRRFIIILFLFLLVGGGITFSAIWNRGNEAGKPSLTNTGTKTNSAPNTTSNTNTPTNKSNPATNAANTNKGADAGNPVSVTPPVQKSPNADITPAENVPAGAELYKKPEQSGKAGVNTKKAKNPTTDKPQTANRDSDKQAAQKTDMSKTDRSKTDEQKINEQPVQPQTVNDKPQTVQPDTQNNKPATTNTETNTEKANTEKTSDKPTAASSPKKNKQTPELKNRWEFGLVYAPDLSTVKFTHTQRPGSNLGLTIGYNISKRFSVQTGLLYTFKNYKSRGEDYHPPKDYWTSYYKIETVTAECNMWDIPLNLRYNLAPRKNSNLFVSTGLSSYLMRKEDYDFFYYYSGVPTSRYRSMDTDSKNWFSVLNLSVGYERQISRNISVQAEPFFKQPLSGVGFGKVKLNSTGIFLSVKYKPLKK